MPIHWKPFLAPSTLALKFAIKTLLAGGLALWCAFRFDLEQPQWALMTVLIVSQPLSGMVVAKGLFRLLGTLVGTAMSVLMIALFAQAPWLFLLAISLWLGLCTAASTSLRNHVSYAFVLSGYTVAIIGLPAVDQPLLVFEQAVARCTEICLGIICASAVSAILWPQRVEQNLDKQAHATWLLGMQAARGEIDAGVESGIGGQRLGLFEGYAGVEVEGLAGRIQPMYAVQPAQREQHVAGLRGAAADQAGESALGYQGASCLAAQTHHGGDLVGAFRQDQEASGEVLRMVAGVLPGERGTVAHATGAEDLAEGAVEFGIVHGGLRVRDGRARLAAPRRSADGPPGRRAAVRAGARDRARVRRRSRSRGRWRGSPGCRYRPRAE